MGQCSPISTFLYIQADTIKKQSEGLINTIEIVAQLQSTLLLSDEKPSRLTTDVFDIVLSKSKVYENATNLKDTECTLPKFPDLLGKDFGKVDILTIQVS